MKKLFAKKQLATVALIGALVAAVYLNYYLTSQPALGTDAPATDTSDAAQEPDRLGQATFVDAPVTNSAETEGEQDAEQSENYFDTARRNRTAAREEALSILQEVLDNAGATAAEKASAEKAAETIAANVLQESHIESLVVAKGFADCVVYIDGDHGSVVVEAEELQQQESLQIMEIVVSQADLAPDHIQIMTPKAVSEK